jgi:pimeloyl-ACP methyl ester carboxylesterase
MTRIGVALTATLLLAACSSDPSATSPSSTVAGADSTAARSDVSRHTFTTKDGTVVDYVLYAPPGRTEGTPGKVIFAFPPGGQDIDLAQRLVEDKYRAEALARDYVVFSPAAPSTGLFYTDASAALVPQLLDMAAAQYPPDEGKFDLVGVSNGGLSAFRAALDQPERFRSLVVYPGYSPDGADDPNLAKLKGIGVAMFVGADDDGWRDPSQQTKDILEQQGNTVELHVIPGKGHILGDALPGKDLLDALERVRG